MEGRELQSRQERVELVSWLVGALSPVNHRGLHQGSERVEVRQLQRKQEDGGRERVTE